jgi:hypothetical protein
MDQFIFKPDADFEGLSGDVRDQMEFDIFSDGDMWDIDIVVEE